jgi:hypothetical protein
MIAVFFHRAVSGGVQPERDPKLPDQADWRGKLEMRS